jgi:hypothetical protein
VQSNIITHTKGGKTPPDSYHTKVLMEDPFLPRFTLAYLH